MKISVESILNIYRQNPASQVTKRDESVSEKKRDKNFDEIKISSEAEAAMEEKEFVRAMKTKLSESVRQKVPDEKLESLREGVLTGNYNIDISAIASRILLEG